MVLAYRLVIYVLHHPASMVKLRMSICIGKQALMCLIFSRVGSVVFFIVWYEEFVPGFFVVCHNLQSVCYCIISWLEDEGVA